MERQWLIANTRWILLQTVWQCDNVLMWQNGYVTKWWCDKNFLHQINTNWEKHLKFICYYFFWFTDPLQIFKNLFNLVKTIDIHLWPLFIVGNINKWLNYSLYASKRSKWNFVMNYPSHSLDGMSHSLSHSFRMFICSFIYYNGHICLDDYIQFLKPEFGRSEQEMTSGKKGMTNARWQIVRVGMCMTNEMTPDDRGNLPPPSTIWCNQC